MKRRFHWIRHFNMQICDKAENQKSIIKNEEWIFKIVTIQLIVTNVTSQNVAFCGLCLLRLVFLIHSIQIVRSEKK